MASQYYCDPKFAAETGSLFEDAEKVAAARESAESDPDLQWLEEARRSLPQEPSLFVDGEMV